MLALRGREKFSTTIAPSPAGESSLLYDFDVEEEGVTGRYWAAPVDDSSSGKLRIEGLDGTGVFWSVEKG
jgi:hypothetical protein